VQLDPALRAYGTRMERISAGPWLTQDGRGEGWTSNLQPQSFTSFWGLRSGKRSQF